MSRWKTWVGVLVSALAIWWAMRGVEWGLVWPALHAADWALLGLVFLLAPVINVGVRAVRWRILLRPVARLSVGSCASATAVGLMANNVLPFRAGELVRVFAATRLSGARFSATISSVAVERIFDGLTVVALLALGLLTSNLPPGVAVGGVPVARAAQFAGVISVAALAAALLVVAFPLAAERLIRVILPAGRLAERLVGELTSEAFRPEQYADEYRTRVLEVVESKVEGKEVTSLAPQAQRTQVIDLMDALKQSLGKRAGAGDGAADAGAKVAALEKKPAARARQKAEPAPREKKVGGKR